jgi:thiol-disulfide isomerase/thioredoxin
MRRLPSVLLAYVLAAGLLGGSTGCARAAESPFVGTWTITLLFPGQDITGFLVDIKDVDGKLQGYVLSTVTLPDGREPFKKDAKVDGISADGDKSLRLTAKGGSFEFPMVVYPAKGNAKKLLGSTVFGGQRRLVSLERSDLKELDPKKSVVNSPNGDRLNAAAGKVDGKEKVTSLKDFLGTKNLEPALQYVASLELLGAMASEGADKEEAAKLAGDVIKLAADYGLEMKLAATQQAAQRFSDSEKLAPLAVDLARDAEKSLDKDTPTDTQAAVLKTLKAALAKTGKGVEAKALAPKIAQLEDQLDQEFIKDAVPFKVEPAARRGKGERVVLVELFTGAQCPPCVAADVAFDALLKSYKASDVVFLQYHLHIPGPDPLTNEDSIKRSEYYGLQGTPTYYIDGDEGPQSGGVKSDGKERYADLVKAIGDALDIGAQGKIKLSAENKSGKIDIHAEVSGLSKTGDDIRLHFVLVEEVARYQGINGQRLHHHVVRGFPGGLEGFALNEKTAKQNVRVNVADLAKSLNDYLDGYKDRKFTEDDRSLNLKHLLVVAFIQKKGTKEIFQAAQIDVPAAGE